MANTSPLGATTRFSSHVRTGKDTTVRAGTFAGGVESATVTAPRVVAAPGRIPGIGKADEAQTNTIAGARARVGGRSMSTP